MDELNSTVNALLYACIKKGLADVRDAQWRTLVLYALTNEGLAAVAMVEGDGQARADLVAAVDRAMREDPDATHRILRTHLACNNGGAVIAALVADINEGTIVRLPT